MICRSVPRKRLIRNEEAKKKRKKKKSNGKFFGKPFKENETAFHLQTTVSRTETKGKAKTKKTPFVAWV